MRFPFASTRETLIGRAELIDSVSPEAESPDRQVRCSYWGCLAEVLAAEGSTREALTTAETAVELAEPLGSAYVGFKLGIVEAIETAIALGERHKANELLKKIEALSRGETTPFLLANRLVFERNSTLRVRTIGRSASLERPSRSSVRSAHRSTLRSRCWSMPNGSSRDRRRSKLGHCWLRLVSSSISCTQPHGENVLTGHRRLLRTEAVAEARA